MAAGDIKAGGAVVTIGVDLSALTRGIKVASNHLNTFGQKLSVLGTSIGALGTAITTPLAAAAVAFANAGSKLADMRARTGLSAQALSELGYAAQLSGSSLDGLEGGLKAMAKNMAKVAQGKVPPVFQALGVDAKKLASMNPEQQFLTIAEAISKVSDPTLQAGYAMQAFGKAGSSLLPMIKAGSAGIEAMRKEARDLGISMSDLDATAADDLGDAMDKLRSALGGSIVKIGSSLVPILTNVLNSIANIVGYANQWIGANKQLFATIAMIGVGITAAGAAMIGMGIAAMFVASSITAIMTIAATLTTPFALAAIAAVAIGGGILYATGAMGALWQMASQVFAKMLTGWNAFANALAAGDVQAAFAVVSTAIQLAWATAVAYLQSIWNTATAAIYNTWQSVTTAIAAVGISSFFAISDAWATVMGLMEIAFGKASDVIRAGLLTIQQGFDMAILAMRKLAGEDVMAEVGIKTGKYAAALGTLKGESSNRDASIAQKTAERMAANNAAKGQMLGNLGGGTFSPTTDTTKLEEARKAYEAAVARAAEATKPGGATAGGGFDPMGFNLQSGGSKSESVGTFNAAAVGRMGASSLADQQYDLTKRLLTTMQSVDTTLKDMDDDQ